MYAASDRKYNIIVFGATGFTGKHIIEEILKTIKAGHSETFTWAVAGRSLEKLEETLNEVSKITGYFHTKLINYKLYSQNQILPDLILWNRGGIGRCR